MTAEVINDGLLAYRMVEHTVDGVDITSRYSGEATVPGPTIVLTEGDKVVLTIRNGLTMRPDQQVSVHTHGVHYMILSDGTLKVINKVEDEGAYPVAFYTYLWDVAAGTAGTWPYHDHNFLTHNGSEHRGLFGAHIVNPASGAVTASVEGNTHTDDRITSLAGYGGQGVLAIPNVYNSWVKNLPDEWKSQLTPAQQNPSHR